MSDETISKNMNYHITFLIFLMFVYFVFMAYACRSDYLAADKAAKDLNKCIIDNTSEKPSVFERDVIEMYCGKCNSKISVTKDGFYVRCK